MEPRKKGMIVRDGQPHVTFVLGEYFTTWWYTGGFLIHFCSLFLNRFISWYWIFNVKRILRNKGPFAPLRVIWIAWRGTHDALALLPSLGATTNTTTGDATTNSRCWCHYWWRMMMMMLLLLRGSVFLVHDATIPKIIPFIWPSSSFLN